MKYRVSQWLDTSDLNAKAFSMRYGVQAKEDGVWKHCHRDGDPLIFKTINEAQTCITELEKQL